jgi:hypothetical protein
LGGLETIQIFSLTMLEWTQYNMWVLLQTKLRT